MPSSWPNSMVNFQSLFRHSAASTLWLILLTAWESVVVSSAGERLQPEETGSYEVTPRDDEVNQAHSIKVF